MSPDTITEQMCFWFLISGATIWGNQLQKFIEISMILIWQNHVNYKLVFQMLNIMIEMDRNKFL